MKKVILIFVLILGFAINSTAQTYKYYSTSFAYKAKNAYGYWSDWSDWDKSHCLITLSFDRNVINIYSDTPQEFDIYDSGGESDDENGSTLTYHCVDKQGLRCDIRFRKQDNGVLQMYIDYNDLMYVYCIERRN